MFISKKTKKPHLIRFIVLSACFSFSALAHSSYAEPYIFADDLDKPSLIQALENQLGVMKNIEASRPVKLGTLALTHARLQDTLVEFLSLLNQNLPLEEFDRLVREKFVVHQVGDGEGKQILFTGYYTPVIKASRTRSEKYIYPLYQMPESLFKPILVEQGHLSGVYENDYHSRYQMRNITREDIDARNALANLNLEIAWLESDIERFFLHIQGSGILKYEDGTAEGVQYAGSNGYPYEAIGKQMAKDGAIRGEEISMQGIKNYLQNHPGDIPTYFYRNQRYIFFRLTDDRPRGSGGAELVTERSIATDKTLYPAGGLVFVEGKKPILNENNEVVEWRGFSRFVVDQDTGNAIKGPNRVDLYFGAGDRAGAMAGRYVTRNRMYYLLKRE
jgi:membrane-bound lytic murein transglycosylase A